MNKSLLRSSLLRATLLAFAFFTLLTTFVEALYTLGLLGVDIPPEIASVVLLLLPLALLFPRMRGWRVARWALAAALVCQGVSPFLPTRIRMIVTGLGVGLFLLALPALLRRTRAAETGGGLALAGLLTIALRALTGGSMILTAPVWSAANTVLMAAGLFLLFSRVEGEAGEPAPASTGFGRVLGFYLGLTGALALLYFGFLSPTVLARWTGGSSPWLNAALVLSLAAFLGAWLLSPRFRDLLTARVLAVWGALFALLLAAALLPHQPVFPADPAAYPVTAPEPGALPQIALVLAALLHPVLYAAAARLAEELRGAAPRALAGAAGVSALVLLLLIFAHVFTTVYDYIPVVGPLFRDRFWLVTVFPAVMAVLALLLARRERMGGEEKGEERTVSPVLLGGLALAGVLLALPPLLWSPAAPPPEMGANPLRVMTYNIQQGYDTAGENAYARLLDTVRAEAPDILGVQESDTARIANGNGDVVRYLAEGLGMASYYGPSSASGTFGIALLSRYPIENPRTFFLSSEGEQTAAIVAEIRANGKTYTVIVTHLGNSGPLVQQQQVLTLVEGKQNVVMMGDFNFRPGSEQYAQTTALLTDAWESSEWQGQPDDGFDPARRIDHVFVSPGLRVANAVYLPEGVSDHPGLVVEVE